MRAPRPARRWLALRRGLAAAERERAQLAGQLDRLHADADQLRAELATARAELARKVIDHAEAARADEMARAEMTRHIRDLRNAGQRWGWPV